MNNTLAVTFELDACAHAALSEALAGAAQMVDISRLGQAQRQAALHGAQIVLARHPMRELSREELAMLVHLQLIQLMTAGVDFIPIGELPTGVPVASNAGAYSEPMAEHALALTLAATKRLLTEHSAIARGEFKQHAPNRMLGGMVCGILRYGGIGRSTARQMRCIGAQIHAPSIAVATAATHGLPGAGELARMKDDAIVVNLYEIEGGALNHRRIGFGRE